MMNAAPGCCARRGDPADHAGRSGSTIVGQKIDDGADQQPGYLALRAFLATAIASGEIMDSDPGALTNKARSSMAWVAVLCSFRSAPATSTRSRAAARPHHSPALLRPGLDPQAATLTPGSNRASGIRSHPAGQQAHPGAISKTSRYLEGCLVRHTKSMLNTHGIRNAGNPARPCGLGNRPGRGPALKSSLPTALANHDLWRDVTARPRRPLPLRHGRPSARLAPRAARAGRETA